MTDGSTPTRVLALDVDGTFMGCATGDDKVQSERRAWAKTALAWFLYCMQTPERRWCFKRDQTLRRPGNLIDADFVCLQENMLHLARWGAEVLGPLLHPDLKTFMSRVQDLKSRGVFAKVVLFSNNERLWLELVKEVVHEVCDGGAIIDGVVSLEDMDETFRLERGDGFRCGLKLASTVGTVLGLPDCSVVAVDDVPGQVKGAAKVVGVAKYVQERPVPDGRDTMDSVFPDMRLPWARIEGCQAFRPPKAAAAATTLDDCKVLPDLLGAVALLT